MGVKVRFKNVTKKFKMYSRPTDKLRDLFSFKERGEFHYALKEVSFDIEEGEIVGVIGINGAGKSTLSNLISGVTMPTEGIADVRGNASLIAISSGLNSNLTGLENIELKGLMLGLTKNEINEITPKVIEFADIGKFVNQPVKTYSSGMKARLGFAISVNIDPDILVIDEALSVGDPTFTDRCMEKMNEFKEKGKTIFFISHSLSQVKKFCTKALWLHNGQVVEYGDINQVSNNYSTFLNEYRKLSPEEKKEVQATQVNSEESHETKPVMSRRKIAKRTSSYKRTFGIALLICSLFITAFLNVAESTLSYSDTKSFLKEKFTLQEHKEQVKEKKDSEKAIDEGSSETTDVEEEEPPFELAVINRSLVNLRDKAELNSQIFDQAAFGDSYKILDEKLDPIEDMSWFRIRLESGNQVWVSSTVVNVIESEKISVNNDLPVIKSLLTERHLPSSFDDLQLLFTESFEQTKNQFTDQVINEVSDGENQKVELNNLQFLSNSDEVQELTLQNISISPVELLEELGEADLESNIEGTYVYFINNFNIKVSVDQSQDNVNTISLRFIR
jgi:teichoic acid transport system ATP-binding protein